MHMHRQQTHRLLSSGGHCLPTSLHALAGFKARHFCPMALHPHTALNSCFRSTTTTTLSNKPPLLPKTQQTKVVCCVLPRTHARPKHTRGGCTHLTRQGAAVAPALVHTGKAVQQVDSRHAHVAEPNGAVVDTIQTHLHGQQQSRQ